MNSLKCSPKDARIIRDNAGASPQALFALGLSNKAYQRILEHEQPAEPAATANIQPVSVMQAQVGKPMVKPVPARLRLHNLRTGLTIMVGYATATRLATQYPKEFKILS